MKTKLLKSINNIIMLTFTCFALSSIATASNTTTLNKVQKSLDVMSTQALMEMPSKAKELGQTSETLPKATDLDSNLLVNKTTVETIQLPSLSKGIPSSVLTTSIPIKQYCDTHPKTKYIGINIHPLVIPLTNEFFPLMFHNTQHNDQHNNPVKMMISGIDFFNGGIVFGDNITNSIGYSISLSKNFGGVLSLLSIPQKVTNPEQMKRTFYLLSHKNSKETPEVLEKINQEMLKSIKKKSRHSIKVPFTTWTLGVDISCKLIDKKTWNLSLVMGGGVLITTFNNDNWIYTYAMNRTNNGTKENPEYTYTAPIQNSVFKIMNTWSYSFFIQPGFDIKMDVTNRVQLIAGIRCYAAPSLSYNYAYQQIKKENNQPLKDKKGNPIIEDILGTSGSALQCNIIFKIGIQYMI